MNEHQITLGKKQAVKLRELLTCFYASAKVCNSFDPRMLLLINGVLHAILEEDPLQQYQIDIILWIADCVFGQMDDDSYDPQLEQMYYKLSGYWPVDPPWYVRIKPDGDRIYQHTRKGPTHNGYSQQ